MSSICVELTADPAINWWVAGLFVATVAPAHVLSEKAPRCSGLVSRQAPGGGELAGVSVPETAMAANKKLPF